MKYKNQRNCASRSHSLSKTSLIKPSLSQNPVHPPKNPRNSTRPEEMKREGRPHGMVRTFTVLPSPVNPRPGTRILNKLDSPPVAGIFAKVPSKPTNHSKFTGKCERVRCSNCHIHPVGKSKDKSKGTQKSRASDAALNYKLVTWRVMSDRDSGLRKLPVASGYSASRILDELADEDQFDYDDHEDDGNVDHVNGYDVEDNCEDHVVKDVDGTCDVIDDDNVDDEDGEDVINFYDVGVVWDPVEDDEGWSLVVAGR